MAEISEKQTETEDLHNQPFDPEIFHNTFNGYVRKFHTTFVILVIATCAPFVVYMIAWYLEMTKVDITGFLDLWHTSRDLLLDLGFPHVSYSIISSGMISAGNFSVGIISVGINFSCGVISIGGFGSCGVISIGGLSSVGVMTIGYSHVYGVIAIATGSKNISDRYPGGQALGFMAFGRRARGVYALSYTNEGEGTYQFSPNRQDAEAVALFTRWFRKFKDAFVLPSQNDPISESRP